MRFPPMLLWLITILASPYLPAEDPCGYKARNGALGQAADQLFAALALRQEQRDAILAIQYHLEESSEKLVYKVEISRQKLFDATLNAGQDSEITEDERDQLSQLRDNQRKARQSLIDTYKQALKKIVASLSPDQETLLTTHVPEIELSEETLTEAREMLVAFRQVRQKYLQASPTLLDDLQRLKTKIDEARFLVYIPPWIDLQIEAISTDLSAYQSELTQTMIHARPINEAELRESDLILDNAVSFLSNAVELAKKPGSAHDPPEKMNFRPLDFNKSLLVSPVLHCLLSDP